MRRNDNNDAIIYRRAERAAERRRATSSYPKVSLIIPTLNEAENLKHVLPKIPSLVDELIIVDGASEDATVEVVEALRPDAQVIVDGRRGKGNALRTGFQAATGDILIIMDADGSMDPIDIGTFVASLEAGADVAKGSRFLQGGGSADLTRLRHLGNFVLTKTVRATFGGRFSDLCYGYMAFWRHVLPTFEGEVQGFEIETFLNVRALAAGLRIVEVASFESPRIHGQSHLRTFRDGSRVLRTIARERYRLVIARAQHGIPRPLTTPVPVQILPQTSASKPDEFSPSMAPRLLHEVEGG
jgi:glycosyltransferase involved in cell wall biosynthesis